MFTSQEQQNFMEIPTGVHEGFKVTKPNRFSNVQRTLKPWLTMVAINFRVYPTVFPTKESKILFAISYLDGVIFNWVQPRLEFFLENDDKKQKQETQQMFYKFDNFCIYIKKVFGNQDEDKTIKKQLLILKQTQFAMVYGSRFKTLVYTIKWDDAAFASKFYEKLKKRVKDATVAMDKPESLKNIINVAVKIDDRQHDKFVDKKIWFKPIPKNKPQFKKDLMEFDVTKKKGFKKKTCYVCRKLGHLKRNCPKKTIKVWEKWIEMIEEPERATKINHENLSWTACSDYQCKIHRSFKENIK